MLVDDLFESRSNFGVGDPVVITGNVEYQGRTGDVREVGRDGAFVVVDLYNYGPYSFHASDVSYNDYADSDEEDERAQGVAEGGNAKTIKPITLAAKRYHEKHKWLLNGNIPGAAKEHYDMIQKLNQKGVAEQEKVGNMPADKFDDAMARLKQLAGAGPLKTVWDPQKRVYKNMPTAVQPKK